MTRALILAGALVALAIPSTVRAQSSLPGAAAKAAAQHAVAATDAHTERMSGPNAVGADAQAAPHGPGFSTAIVRSDVQPAASQTRATPPVTRAPSSRTAPPPPPTPEPAAPAADTSTLAHAGSGVMTFRRETFSYAGGGRRDPFTSLLRAGGDLRPLISDLRLVTIVYDASGRNSVAILRDLTTKEQYRVRVGQTLGRMRVAQIQPRQVVFTIEEFGYSRQETLMYNDPNTMRSR